MAASTDRRPDQVARMMANDGQCAVCGGDAPKVGPVRDYYELTHCYYELDGDGLMAFVSPETVTTLVFCSASCSEAVCNSDTSRLVDARVSAMSAISPCHL